MSEALMLHAGEVEIVARDRVALRRRINEQERAAGCIVRGDVPAPRLRKRYHAFVKYDGTIAGCAVIRPKLIGGWSIHFGMTA